MPKLITHSLGAPVELSLKPGLNRIGRSPANDFALDHASVSNAHCEITVDAGVIYVCDLGSTNGTLIDGQPIRDGFLQPGQILQIGEIEFSLADDISAEPQPKQGSLKVAKLVEAPPPPVSIAPRVQSARNYPVGPQAHRTFFQKLPGAFAYPVKRESLFVLIIGTLVFGALDFASFVLHFFGLLFLVFWLFIALFGLGYLAAFMKKIIVSSAQGDEDLPDLPEISDWWEDIFHPAIVLLACFAVAFGPAVSVYLFLDADAALKTQLAIALGILGCLYLPMALIATSMYDSVMALNPLLIVPSIVKIPAAYVTACAALALLLITRTGVNMAIDIAGIPVISTIVASFASVYFLSVEMRILGLLYEDKKDVLNWRF